jgi:hypothetical protein
LQNARPIQSLLGRSENFAKHPSNLVLHLAAALSEPCLFRDLARLGIMGDLLQFADRISGRRMDLIHREVRTW